MMCMEKALAELPMDTRLHGNIHQALSELATHMMNQAPEHE
jgi:hemoglobin